MSDCRPQYWPVVHCTACHSNSQKCTVLHITVLAWITLHQYWYAVHWTVMACSALHSTSPLFSAQYSLQYSAHYCTVGQCTLLHCSPVHITTLQLLPYCTAATTLIMWIGGNLLPNCNFHHAKAQPTVAYLPGWKVKYMIYVFYPSTLTLVQISYPGPLAPSPLALVP